MGEISDTALISALRRGMTVAVAKQVASAGNLANVDTPGFKAKQVTFDDTLGSQLEGLRTTHPQHLQAGAGGATVRESDAPARRDGNNVQLDHELLSMSRAAGDFAAAQTALAAKFRLVRYAINEGR
ncbi:MAG: flagellar basal body rod protein FlgB [Acidobacteria bacterium]|nr:flagellar basal body rod protein FlgB [Acidobacteriota bacterium]